MIRPPLCAWGLSVNYRRTERAFPGCSPFVFLLEQHGADEPYEGGLVGEDRDLNPNIPNRSNRRKKYRWKKALYRERNRVERFFNKLKNFRRIATRYDKLGANFFAFIQLASIRIYLRSIESTT